MSSTIDSRFFPDAITDIPFQIDLHSTEGGSDKVYRIALDTCVEGVTVTAANGRRGGPLTLRQKGDAVMSFSTARALVEGLVKEKLKKGYRPVSVMSGSVTSGVSYERPTETGVRLALAEVFEEANVDTAIADPGKAFQEKFDGERLAVRCRDGVLTGINRRGQTRTMPPDLVASLHTDVDYIVDGELLGHGYRIFDILEIDGQDLRPQAFQARFPVLLEFAPSIIRDVTFAEVARTETLGPGKRSLLEDVRERNGEGIVIKDMNASYFEGRSAAYAKLKFWNSLSAIVLGESGGKRSVRLGLLDGDRPVDVGAVTIPEGREVPDAGSVVEVRYLYAYPNGSLFQPVLLGVRGDIPREECVLSQRVLHATPEGARASAPVRPTGPVPE